MSFSISFVKAIGIATALGLLLVSSPSHARKVCFGKDERLEVVADTKLKAADGAALVLAHKTTTHCFLAPYWLSDDGFVLGVKGNNKVYYPLPDPEKLSALQAEGLVPSQFPIWERSLVDWILGYLIWWVILGLMIYLGYLKLKNPKSAYSSKAKGQNVSAGHPGIQTLSISTEPAGPVHSLASLDEITGPTKSSKKSAKPKVRWKTVSSIVALVVVGAALYLALPREVQYELQDTIKRPFTPNFDLPPNQMKSAKQDEWIAEYRNRGYDLRCYGSLRPEEQISKDDDYNCWGIIKSAYDNIPARMIAFWFRKGELQHIKIELPEKSFAPLQDFLGRHFEGIKRLDQLPNARFGKDIYGKPLMVWPAKHGIIVASNAPTPAQPLTLLWTSKEKITRDIVAELQSQIQAHAKSTSQTSNSIGTPPAAPSAAPPSTRVSAASMPAPTQAPQVPPAQSAVTGQASATTARPGQSNTLATVNTLAPNIAHIETKGNIKSTSSPGHEAQQQPAQNNGPAAPPAQAPRPAPAHNIVVANAKTFQPKRRKPSDLRYCLDLPSNYAIAKCAEQ